MESFTTDLLLELERIYQNVNYDFYWHEALKYGYSEKEADRIAKEELKNDADNRKQEEQFVLRLQTADARRKQRIANVRKYAEIAANRNVNTPTGQSQQDELVEILSKLQL